MPFHFESKPSLIVYITCGDPDLVTTRDVILAAIDAGASVIELGVPFSDPLADGPVIQRASERALKHGTSLQNVLTLAAEIREHSQSVGWDPVAAGLVEPDEAYKGKRVHKIHVAKNGDLFLETHGFRPGVISGVLLDSSTAEKRGGTGEAFDWERVQPWAGIINSISKLIVAGGLHPDNVQEAIHVLHPWGVDVSTGVESVPGRCV